MRQPRSQVVLWSLTGVLVLALPLLAFLQVRWARQLGNAEVERLRLDTVERLDGAKEELGRELLQWTFAMQGELDAGPPLVNPRAGWQLESPLSDLLRNVYLVQYEGASGEEHWFRLPPAGAPVPLGEPVMPLIHESYGPMVFSLLPRPFDDERMVLRVMLLDGEILPLMASAAENRIVTRTSFLMVVLDRPALASWFEGLLSRHLGQDPARLDYGVAATGSGYDDVWVLGTPRSAAADQEDILHRVEMVLESKDGLGHTFASRAEACEAGGCENDADTGESAETREGPRPPRYFVSMPDKLESWRLEVRNHRSAVDPRLQRLWARNLAIGLAALAVLGIAVGLLVALTMQYQRLARAQFDFVTGVTHELRTPLSVLGSASANLADGLVSEDRRVRQYGQVLRKEVARLSDLVERVLGFTRAQRESDEPARAELSECINRVVQRLAAEAAERRVEVEVDVDEGLPAVATHGWLLDSLVQNLLSNALKYGGERVRIEASVTTGRRRPVVTLTVRDWGPGLGRFERRRIFEPFFRGRKARRDQQPGAGLGLSWVARLVQRAGGRLVVESKPGQGSRFGVELPTAGTTA